MTRAIPTTVAAVLVIGISTWAAHAAAPDPSSSAPAPAGVIVNDDFTGVSGSAISGRSPDAADAPGAPWSVVAFNLGGGFSATVDAQAGNPAPLAHLSCAGNSNGAIAIPISSRGSYTKPQRLTISALLRGADPALGFYSALPVQDPDGVFDVFANFTGLRLLSGAGDSPDDGTLVLYRSGTVVARVGYTGAFHAADLHKLSYDVDTRSGAIGAVTLEGSTSDYAAFAAAGAFTDAATAYAAIASLCESGRDNQAYASHFMVADHSASPAAPPPPPPAAAKPETNHAPILVHDGDRIGFMGDSITALGNAPKGYVQLVIAGLKAEGVQAAAIPAGHSGDTSGNMVYRTNPDVLHQGATWMTLSCGVNDVATPSDGSGRDLADFRSNVTRMVAKAQGWNVRVLLLTTTPRGEDLNNEYNQRLAAYNDFLRQFAKEKNLPLADVNAAFLAVLNSKPPEGAVPGRRLLADGLHPNDAGQFLMATTVLQALGVPKADMPRVEKTLQDGIKGHGQR